MSPKVKQNGADGSAKTSHGPCRLCGAPLYHSLVDLGKSPLCETFLDAQQIDRMEPFFPLHVFVCDKCWLVQLKEYVAADGIFTDHYPYFSSFSTSWVAHAKAYCEMITARRNLDAKSFVVELACNDGYLLQHFAPLGVTNILGVEPSGNVAQVAKDKGDPSTLLVVRKGLNIDGAHKGGPAIFKGDDAELCISGWIKGKPQPQECARAARPF